MPLERGASPAGSHIPQRDRVLLAYGGEHLAVMVERHVVWATLHGRSFQDQSLLALLHVPQLDGPVRFSIGKRLAIRAELQPDLVGVSLRVNDIPEPYLLRKAQAEIGVIVATQQGEGLPVRAKRQQRLPKVAFAAGVFLAADHIPQLDLSWCRFRAITIIGKFD
jgi:hypothetical protein